MNLNRPRSIVKLAASQTKAAEVKNWLIRDEQGAWEKMARDYLARVPALMEQQKIVLSDSQIDDEIATAIRLAALEASIARAKKEKRR